VTSEEIALEIARIDLVIANRVLARIGAVDAFGHVSVRHPLDPKHFLLSCSRSPDLVDRDDLMEFDLEGRAVGLDNRPAYLERFIHSAIYEARPDVNAIVHGHARVLLPFSVTDLELRPLFLTAHEFGSRVPKWDIRDTFGDTDLHVANTEQGRDLAAAFRSEHNAVLLRGHGFVGAGRSVNQLIRLCNALLDNARLQLEASRFGAIKELTPGEIEARRRNLHDDESPSLIRAFEYEAIQAGQGEMFAERMRLKAQQQAANN